MQTSGSNERRAMADGSWMIWSMGGLAGIWTAVVLISVLAPDMVSGSEQEHLPVAAFTAPLWGLVATGGFLWAMGKLRGSGSRRPIWIGLAVATLTVWLGGGDPEHCVAGRRDRFGSHAPSDRRHGLARGRSGAHRLGGHHRRSVLQTASGRLSTSEEHGLMWLHLAGGQDTLACRQPEPTRASYTI
jgi:hypothetical protein